MPEPSAPGRAGALCSNPALLCAAPASQPCLVPQRGDKGAGSGGGGSDREGERASAQVSSSSAAGRRGGQHLSRPKRHKRRCHCRHHRRATPGRPARPRPPRNTPPSTSGAPRRSSLRRLAVGCLSHTRPGRSGRPGKKRCTFGCPRLRGSAGFAKLGPAPKLCHRVQDPSACSLGSRAWGLSFDFLSLHLQRRKSGQ